MQCINHSFLKLRSQTQEKLNKNLKLPKCYELTIAGMVMCCTFKTGTQVNGNINKHRNTDKPGGRGNKNLSLIIIIMFIKNICKYWT